jgi:predicted Zn-dependent protease
MTNQEKLDFVQAAVKASGTRDAIAVLKEERTACVRFGQNRITQNLDIIERELSLTVGDGEKQATVTSQKITFDALQSIAADARSLLKTSSPDPEYMSPVSEKQVYPVINEAWDSYTAECPAEPRMKAVGKAIDLAEENGFQTAGRCWMQNQTTYLATSTGNLVSHRSTQAGLSFTMDKGLASSYRTISGTGWNELDVDGAIHKVVEQVKMNEGAVDAEDGDYKIILEPEAVWNLLMYLPWIMDARSADEGTSVFSGMEGIRMAGGNFNLSSRLHSAHPGIPFNEYGQPARDVVWFENGILRNLPCDRFTAKKTGREPLFVPETLTMEGGEGTIDNLVAGVEKGILIRRFWYIRFVDEKTLKLTGMTRDGVFLVENGKIVKPLKDFRWNWRPFDLFSNIERMGTSERKFYGMVPPVVISACHYPFTD